MSARQPGVVQATLQGLGLVLRAPGLLLGIALITLLTALPFALVVDSEVMTSLALQPAPSPIGAPEIDPEWWLEFRRHASGLAATFTPAILGFAAPLDTVSALLDGRRPPAALLLPVGLSALVWAFLWGGIIHRFMHGATSLSAFMSAASRHFVRMFALTLIAAAASLVIYLTIHPLLLGVVYDAIAPRLSHERDAFAVRIVLYVIFVAVLALVNAVVAFARVHAVAGGERNVMTAIRQGWTFVMTCRWPVAALYFVFFSVFAIAMVGYGALELNGGARVGGWRAVAIGQAFILFRLALRLAFSASQVRLAAQAGANGVR